MGCPPRQQLRRFLSYCLMAVRRDTSLRYGCIRHRSSLITYETFFTQCATGHGARAFTEGEYQSASAINSVVPGFGPTPTGWGKYRRGESLVYFILAEYHDMNLSVAPEPVSFTTRLTELHSKGKSPTGMFGFPVPTVIGRHQRTVTWEKNWAKCFANQLKDAIKWDNGTNTHWPEYDAACQQLIDRVVPRLLGALQSGGRDIEPALIHGDLWEPNIGIDKETGKTVVFDPGSIYAHNEMEFGTWRCSWAYYFNSPIWMRLYQRHIEPSEPVEEWDDRNWLYSLHPHLAASASHAGNVTRSM
jgi:protein-ribulosamine 3-kinase